MPFTTRHPRPRRVWIAGFLWLATVQFFVVEALVQSRWEAAYNRQDYYISDLGALGCSTSDDGRFVCSPWHGLMNTSFIVQGVLIAGGAVLLRTHIVSAATRWTAVTIALLVTAGLGVAVVGLAPEDTVGAAHYAGAAANFVAGNLGLVALCETIRRTPGLRAASVWTGCLGVLGLVALGCFVLGARWGIGDGGIERVIAYPLPAALPVVALALLRRVD